MRWFFVGLIVLNLSLWSLPVLAVDYSDYYDNEAIPEIKNPLEKTVFAGDTAKDKVAALTGNVIASIMGIVGSISLIMFIYAGIRFMTARGNAEESKKAMQIMVWATLGLVVIFSSYVILRFIFDVLA